MLNLENLLTQHAIDRLKKTNDLISPSKVINFIAQTLNSIPWTYDSTVRISAEDTSESIENPYCVEIKLKKPSLELSFLPTQNHNPRCLIG